VASGAYAGFGQPGIQPEVFFVVMEDQADTTFAQEIEDHVERYTAVYETLTEQALEDQSDIRAYLDTQHVSYTPYYLVNGIEVVGDAGLRRGLARREDVARVLNSPQARPLPRVRETNAPGLPGGFDAQLTWGVDEMDAERVWDEYGVTGEGIIVGHADSGVDGNHPALRDNYLGSGGSNDYTWFDPWEGTTEPTDSGGHGTHTLGTILGQGGIGVAPGAKWIACRNLARNLGNPPDYLDCMQFLLAPHPQDGDPFTEGDPSRGAHVTSNSWGCPPEEGCDGLTLSIAVQHLRDAGQVFVVSAGNDGPQCSTVWAPASAEAAFSVGAASQSGLIANFSSRGPVLVDESGRLKPEVTAPGVGVLSSVPGGSYGFSDGTSMAGPHVAGLVALVWSANPDLIGDIDATERIIEETAHPHSAPDLCGATEGDQNNVYGYGFVDALGAVEMAMEGE
jgi:subtilisin family serine protease